MTPTWYADLPQRRTRQIVSDALAVLGVLLALWAGSLVDDGVDAVGAPVLRAESAGRALGDQLGDAGDGVSEVPLVGDEVRSPFDGAADAADRLAGSAADSAHRIDLLGTWLGVGATLLLLALVAVAYLPTRLRFVLTATAVRRLRAGGTGHEDDLLALRALAHHPLHLLARRVPDAAGGWRRGDPATVRALADLELRAAGLTPRRADPAPGGPPA